MIRHAPRARAGITLTEILISLLIMSVGLVSLATLFPLGLVRLRDAQRSSRSTYLGETAISDAAANALFDKSTFLAGPTAWYTIATDPWSRDRDGDIGVVLGPGLPVAYDPLWWAQIHQTQGLTVNSVTRAAANGFGFRFGYGVLRDDPNPLGAARASAFGLQRITNFGPAAFPAGRFVYPFPFPPAAAPAAESLLPDVAAEIFTSIDDVVMQTDKTTAQANFVGGLNTTGAGSAVVPDMSGGQVFRDWTYSWMFTGRQMDVRNPLGLPIQPDALKGTIFEGDIVIFHNRAFAIDAVGGVQTPSGERVVEGIFGPPGNDRAVVLRWPATQPDPDVRVGGWIADVTYELNSTNTARFVSPALLPQFGPAQRCHWYKIAKRNPAEASLGYSTDAGVSYRQIVLTVSSPVKSRTQWNNAVTPPQPTHVNAALIAPYVVNVFPKTFYVRN